MDDMTLTQVWAWLPTFRVVAETEHLPTAARRLSVSASAISRTVKLLEDHLGVQLFNRTGRNLVLNTHGQRLLDAVQTAMATMATAAEAVTAEPFAGPLQVSAIGLLTHHYVLPALLDLKRRHPDLVPMLRNYRTTEANERLIQGRLDVSFYYEALTHPDLVIEKIGSTTASVYCGRSHPLFDVAEVGWDQLLQWPFSVPAVGDSGQVMDGWPPDVHRRIGMHIWLLTTNLEVCLSGALVTVLPDVTALAHLQAGALRRFAAPFIAPIPMFAARHRQSAARSATHEVIDGVAAEIARTNAAIATLAADRAGDLPSPPMADTIRRSAHPTTE